MIKKMFNDGCLGIKLVGLESNVENYKKYVRQISPLSEEENELLSSQIEIRDEAVRLFPGSGYRVGWKRSSTFSFIVIVFCPINELGEGEVENGNL